MPAAQPAQVRLVCDSTADISPGFAEAHRLEVVPLKVIFGDEQLDDGVQIDAATFYSRMRAGGPPPRTSQPSPAEFAAAYRRAGRDGLPVLCTTISADLSGTHETARLAAEACPDIDVHVVDSRTAGLGHHQVVAAAVRAAAAGCDRAETERRLARVIASQRCAFTVQNLEYLRRGGRIGGAQALVGSLLSIKPILEVRGGRIEPLDRVRTDARAIERLVREAGGAGDGEAPLRVTIAHAERPDAAAALAAGLRQRSAGEPEIIAVGPVIGCHGGPGSLGVVVHPADSG
ncbi:MAG: DegV family protein [Candidatus Dormibacteria bacterium]